MAKSTGTYKENSRIPLKLIIEKTGCRQKRNTIEQFSEKSVQVDMTTTKFGLNVFCLLLECKPIKSSFALILFKFSLHKSMVYDLISKENHNCFV